MYKILLTNQAKKDYKKIPQKEISKINKIIDSLSITPRPVGHKKLVNRNAYRIRVGDYRVIYEIEDNNLIILLIRIRHRKEVYKNM